MYIEAGAPLSKLESPARASRPDHNTISPGLDDASVQRVSMTKQAQLAWCGWLPGTPDKWASEVIAIRVGPSKLAICTRFQRVHSFRE
jgi:hypothetical protein